MNRWPSLQRQRGDAVADDAPLDVVRNLRHDLAVLEQLHDVPAAQAVRNGDLLVSEPSAVAVALPSGTETNDQQVPVQLTRLPTTVDHSMSTGAFGVRPLAVTATFELTCPSTWRAVRSPPSRREARQLQRRLRVERRSDVLGPVDLRLRPAVVLRDREAELLAGAPRDRRLLDVQVLEADRVGDLDRVRPTGPAARMCATAMPRVQFAIIAPT